MGFCALARAWLAALPCALSAAAGTQSGPSPEEVAALRELARRVSGFVVWESNRSGAWELYRINTDGSDFRQVTKLAASSAALKYDRYLRPRVSPDGRLILFGYADRQGKPVESWLVPAEGGEARSATRGLPLSWSRDGRAFFFVRDSKLWRHELASGAESQVHAATLPVDGSDGNVVGDVRPDLRAVVLRGDSNRYFELDRAAVTKTTGGCEPRFDASGRIMYWVQGPGDFRLWDLRSNEERVFFGAPPTKPYDYTYFPTVSDDERWLAYGASPGQHDHNSSDYEIFLQELAAWRPAGPPVRLSWHPRTDRWPYLYVHRDASPPSAPGALSARVDGRRVRLVWTQSADAESGVAHYTVYRDGKPHARAVPAPGHVDCAVEGGQRYRYQVTATNSAGLEGPPSNIAEATVADCPPSAPSRPEARSTSKGVRLSWAPNPEPDVVGYRVERAYQATGPWEPLATSSSCAFEDPRADQAVRFYRIFALDRDARTSAPSEPVGAGPSRRVTEGLVALYLFDEETGPLARDSAAADGRLDLRASDPAALKRLAGGGVELAGPLVLRDASALMSRLKEAGKLSVEAHIRPANLTQSGPARIVSMSADPGRRNFTLGQAGAELVFRLRTAGTSENGTPELATQCRALGGAPVHVVATFDGQRRRIFVDGRAVAECGTQGGFGSWAEFPLVVGNEATGDRPWLGQVYLVAIYERALSAEEVARNMEDCAARRR